MDSGKETVLSVGDNEELLKLRDLVLRNEGFKVITTSDEKQAIRHIQDGECGTLLVCHSLDERALRTLTENYRNYCAEGRIIGISNVPWPKPPDLDLIVWGMEGPEALIAAIRGTQQD